MRYIIGFISVPNKKRLIQLLIMIMIFAKYIQIFFTFNLLNLVFLGRIIISLHFVSLTVIFITDRQNWQNTLKIN